jgi:hypothetical protein
MLANSGIVPPFSLDLTGRISPDASGHEIRVHPGVFRTVSILALQNVLFLLRIASKYTIPIRFATYFSILYLQSGRSHITVAKSSSAESSFHTVRTIGLSSDLIQMLILHS